jgi:hypothetical protein
MTPTSSEIIPTVTATRRIVFSLKSRSIEGPYRARGRTGVGHHWQRSPGGTDSIVVAGQTGHLPMRERSGDGEAAAEHGDPIAPLALQ